MESSAGPVVMLCPPSVAYEQRNEPATDTPYTTPPLSPKYRDAPAPSIATSLVMALAAVYVQVGAFRPSGNAYSTLSPDPMKTMVADAAAVPTMVPPVLYEPTTLTDVTAYTYVSWPPIYTFPSLAMTGEDSSALPSEDTCKESGEAPVSVGKNHR